MPKKRSSKARRSSSRRRARKKDVPIRDSVLNREEFYLNKHDEEKVLLFLTGLVFGMGLVATILDEFLYAGLAMIVVGLVLLLIELNVEERTYSF
jgi:hypothetical protein